MTHAPLSVEHEWIGKTCRVCVAGEVDLSTAEVLRDRIATLLAAPGLQGIEVDLREVSFMDSSGLRALLQARDLAAEGGVPFVLRTVPGSVTDLLTVAGVRDWFEYA